LAKFRAAFTDRLLFIESSRLAFPCKIPYQANVSPKNMADAQPHVIPNDDTKIKDDGDNPPSSPPMFSDDWWRTELGQEPPKEMTPQEVEEYANHCRQDELSEQFDKEGPNSIQNVAILMNDNQAFDVLTPVAFFVGNLRTIKFGAGKQESQWSCDIMLADTEQNHLYGPVLIFKLHDEFLSVKCTNLAKNLMLNSADGTNRLLEYNEEYVIHPDDVILHVETTETQGNKVLHVLLFLNAPEPPEDY
jgi:hypothetical protein